MRIGRALGIIACAATSLGYGVLSPSVAGLINGRQFIAARGPYMDYAPLSALTPLDKMFCAEVQPVLRSNGAIVTTTSIMETRIFGHHMMEASTTDSLATPRFESHMTIYRCGFPFISGESTHWFVVDRTAPNPIAYSGQARFTAIRVPVLGPVPMVVLPPLIWRGALLNSMCFAAAYAALLWGLPWLRRRIRTLRGRCVGCGYTSQEGRACPECGLGHAMSGRTMS